MVTSTLSSFRSKLPYVLVGLFVLIACLFKIADLDFWWHLKTGQIIFEQKAFQHTEIYSYTAYGREYVDHEWLFQVVQYLLFHAAGPTGVILFKSAVLIATYLLLTRLMLHQNADPFVAVPVIFLSVCAGRTRFIERPEIFTILFLVSTYLLIDSYLRTGKRNRLLWILPIFLLWSNIHAAVILGLVLQLFFLAGLLVELLLRKSNYPLFYHPERKPLVTLVLLFIASLLVTGVNPTGYRILKVPFELTGLIDSGLLKNQEWQPPLPTQFPFYYAALLFTFLILVVHFRKLHFVNFLLASFLGYISLKYLRNVGLFSICMPMIVAPYMEDLSRRLQSYRTGLVAVATALAVALITLSPYEFGIGVSSYFPTAIIQFTKDKNLQGNMLNAYAFGGYFIWSLYPERKIFLDGRNEVYLPLLKEITEVRMDSRKWKAFLEKYRIEYALLNYVDELEEVTVMGSNHEVTKTYAPFTSTHFPRSRWALIYWDDNGMIFIRRDGPNRKLLPLEYTSVFPEGTYYHESLARAGRLNLQKAVEEITRKLKEDPSCKRARHLLKVTQSSS